MFLNKYTITVHIIKTWDPQGSVVFRVLYMILMLVINFGFSPCIITVNHFY